MFRLDQFRIATLTTIIISLLVVTVLGAGGLGWVRDSAEQTLIDAQERRMASYLLADELRQSSDDLTRLARTYVVTGDPRWEKQYLEILAIRSGEARRPDNYHQIYWDFRAASDVVPPASGEAVDLLELMKRAGMTEAELDKLAEARANSDALVRTETIAMNLVKGLRDDGKGNFSVRGEPDLTKAREMMHDAAYHSNKARIMKPVNEFLGLLDQRTRDEVKAANTLVQRWTTVFWVFATIMFALCGLAVVLVFRMVTSGLRKATSVADRIAGGDLSASVPEANRSEIGDLLTALGSMRNALVQTVGQVRRATDSINTASHEIAVGNQDLSARTEQTASNLQQTAASMEQLTSTVRQSADAARQANQLASSAAEIAARGGQVVGQVVSTMDEINHSSKKIGDIIGVIDGIAFQTNILALNAAVEAARAGEQGRGFAVVAGEVRNLAQRSAEAAKEIKGLIGASVNRVEAGSRLVADAGQTMTEIVGSVQRVSDIIGEITTAAGEQSDGIGQVNTAVTQLDQMTQQNAALVEESTAAAESLMDQAVQLARVVQTFRLDGSDGSFVAAGLSAPTRAPEAGPAPAALKRPQASAAPVPVVAGADSRWESF